MATTNLGLDKTVQTDTMGTAFNIFNGDMDTLDSKIGAIGNSSVKALIDGKAGKVASATDGNFAGLNSSGELTDSGKKPSDFALSAEVGSVPSGKTVEGQITELSDGKADKVASATNGDFAGLDSNGNLTDSGKKASDFATPGDITEIQNAIGTVPAGKTVEGQITELHETKADVIEESITTPADEQTFSDGADGLPMGIEVAVEPVQDLHGYDSPWAGGAGKNIAYLSVNHIKNANSGTWDGNVTVINNVTFTILTDSDGNVTGIKANGTASANTGFYLFNNKTIPAGSYILSGCPVSGNENIWLGTFYDNSYQSIERGSGVSFTLSQDKEMALRFRVGTGQSVSNVVVLPMIRLASVTDDSFAPYSNICPITGFTQANVSVTGKNLIPYPYVDTTRTKDTLVITANSDGTISANGTPNANAFFDLFTASQYFTLKAGTYKIPATGNENIQFQFYKTNGTVISNGSTERTFTLTDDTDVYCFLRFASGQQFSSVTVKPMLLIASETNTEWEAYNGTTYPITFPTEAGTVYGGTLTVEKDGSGTLVVDSAIATNSSTISRTTNPSTGGLYGYKFDNCPYTAGANGLLISSEWQTNKNGTSAYSSTVPCLSYNPNSPYEIRVYSTETTVDAFKTAHPNIQIVYSIAQQTYTLTAPQVKTILGTNNLWADCGGVNRVDYNADTKKYIDNLFATIVNATGVSF